MKVLVIVQSLDGGAEVYRAVHHMHESPAKDDRLPIVVVSGYGVPFVETRSWVADGAGASLEIVCWARPEVAP